MPKLLVQLPYSIWLEVTPEQLDTILKLNKYEKEGNWDNKVYKPISPSKAEETVIDYVPEEKFPSTEPEVIAMEEVLSENNRLRREVEDLEYTIAQMKKKTVSLDKDIMSLAS